MKQLLQNWSSSEEKKVELLKILTTISQQLQIQRKNNTVIPEDKDIIFKAFNVNPQDIKVVILGDIYPTKGIPTGYAWDMNNSVQPNKGFKAILDTIDTLFEPADNFNHLDKMDLSRWVNQGVLLANISLTVVENKPGSHNNLWKPFTEYWMRELSLSNSNIVWLLWGSTTCKYKDSIKGKYVFTENNPVNKTKKFTGESLVKCNEVLKDLGLTTIEWV